MIRLRSAVFLCIPVFAALFAETALAANCASRADLTNCAVRIRYERTEGGSLITGHGTAFGVDLSPYSINSRRLMLSAAHNVLDGKSKPYDTLKIEITEGTRSYWSKCKVVAFDEALDICLVESGDDLPMLAALDTADLQPGSPVVLAGSPRGVPIALFDGEVIRRFDNGTVRSTARLPFDHGDSGGPLFNPSGMKVVGVAVAGVPKNGDLDHNLGLFVPLMAIDSFLQTNLRAKRAQPLAAMAPKASAPAPAIEKPAAEATAFLDPASIQAKRPVVAQAAPQPEPARASAETKAETVFLVPEPKRSAPPTIVTAPTLEIAHTKVELKAPPAAIAKESKPPETPRAAVQAPASVAAEHVTRPAAPAPVRAPVKEQRDARAEIVTELPNASYTVQPGDSLLRIARKYNVSLSDLIAANGIKDPNRINVGTQLSIPSR